MESSLSILVSKKKLDEVLKQKTGAKAFLRSACNVVFFVIFLMLYTSLALSDPLRQYRTFEQYIRRRFDTNAAMPIDDVMSIHTFWEYTNRSFLPGIYSNDTAKYYFPGHVIDIMLPIDSNNRLFGAGARLRMIKIAPNNECEIKDSYSSGFSTCYGPYGEGYVVQNPFGPVGNAGSPIFTYTAGTEADKPYSGKVAEYQPGGYMEALTADYNKSIIKMQELEQNDWVDESVRALFYDFTIYNFNLGLYAVCCIAFEVSPTGSWIKTFSVDIIRQRNINALGLSTTEDWLLLGGEAVLVLFVFRYLLEEASEFLGCEKRGNSKIKLPTVKVAYFFDTWNLLDWLNLILMIVTMGVKVQTWGLASARTVWDGDPSGAGVDTFTDYSAVAQNVRLIRSLTAFNSVLTWFKAVKYITFIPYIQLFMHTVSAAESSLTSFLFVFSCTMIGFMLAYNSAFGEGYAEFRSVFKSLFFLLRAFLGDARMAVVYEAANFLGSLLIILFVVGMIFIMMNLFQAIMISALSDAKAMKAFKGDKEWQKTMDKFQEFGETVATNFRLKARFRSALPGLYSRIQTRQKKKEEKEKLRDENEEEKEAALSLLESDTAPGKFGIGRRAKRVHKRDTEEEDAESGSDGSEADLGPLRSQEHIEPKEDSLFGDFGPSTTGKSGGGMPMLVDKNDPFYEHQEPELEPEAQALVIKAAQYVVEGIVEHAKSARAVLFADMAESKEVLHGISNVLEVLSRRARSLEAQQIDVLRNF